MWCKSLKVLNPYEALKEANMTDLKPCPCKTCQLRQYFAHAFDMHFVGEDCPYQCEMYDEYNCRAGEEGKHENYT